MRKKIQWLFETNNSGRWKGFNDSDIERFKKGRYLSLTREVIQNSNDAILNRSLPVRIEFDLLKVKILDIPDIDGLREKFEKCLPHALADNNPEAGKWFKRANEILKGSTLQVLRMSDFNTTGMTGPCELGTPYFAYMKAMGTSQKADENAGGSHGIGKRAPLACSLLRTLFVITKYKNLSGGTDTLAQGFSALMSHAKTQGSKTGPFVDGEGHWGIADGAMPVDDDKYLPKWLTRNEVGTSIYLMAFDAVQKWKERLIAITLSNYFAAIYRGKLIVKIGDEEINKDTISTLFEDYESLEKSLDDEDEKSRFLSARNFFGALNDANPLMKLDESQLNHLGRTAVRVVVQEGMPSEYAVIRGGMLITTSLPQLKQFPNYKDFVAVAECLDLDGEKLLRRMEPSRHDDFEPDQFESEVDKKLGRATLKELQKHIRESIKRHARETSGEAGPVDFMSIFLADESHEGADNSEVDVNPEGKIVITPKKLKPKKASLSVASGSGGEGPNGETGGDSKESLVGGSGDGDGTGSEPGKFGVGDMQLKNVRLFKAGCKYKISLTSDDSHKVELSIFAIGQEFEEKIKVKTSSRGIVKDGCIELDLVKGERLQLDAELLRESLGAYRVYAREIS